MAKKNKKDQSLTSRTSTPSPAVTNFHYPLNRKRQKALTDEEKIDFIAQRFKEIMEVLGLDLDDDSLTHTPYRVAKMYVKEVFSGLNEDNFPNISFFKEEFHHEHKANLIFIKVGFTSFCEHHFVPMTGYAYVAYIPR